MKDSIFIKIPKNKAISSINRVDNCIFIKLKGGKIGQKKTN
jgi:hypothetical protein